MSKYELQSSAIGLYALLSGVLIFVFHQQIVSGVLVRHLFFLGFIIIWLHPCKDCTETETRLADKATAWTFYGTIIIACGLIIAFCPKDQIIVSNDTFGMGMMYTCFIFVGIRSIVLVILLRKERLKNW